MKLIRTNQTFRSLFLSRVFNTAGSGLFTLAFLVYASTFAHATLYLSIAAIIGVLPSFFGPVCGYWADKTVDKRRALFLSSWLQTVLFLLVVVLIEQKNSVVFGICCVIIVSDSLIASYKNSLEMPIMQVRVPKEETQEAFGLYQGMGSVFSLIEPPLGVALLAAFHNNFMLLASVNAVTYFLSGLVLLESRKALKIDFEPSAEAFKFDFKEIWRSMHTVFGMDGAGTGTAAIVGVIAINFVINGIDGLIDLTMKSYNPFGHNFAFAVMMFNVTLSVAVILGSVFMKDGLQKVALKPLLLIILACGIGMGLTMSNFGIVSLICFAVLGYMMAKINPKFSAYMLEAIPADRLGRIYGGMATINMVASGLGTIIFVGVANVITVPPTLYVLAGLNLVVLLYVARSGRNVKVNAEVAK